METVKEGRINNKALRVSGMIMLALLGVQYILGMITNLFVQFPTSATDGQLWEFAWSQFSEAAHIILGLLLFVGGVIFLIRAVRAKDRVWTVAAAVGLFGILSAIYGGVTFIPSQVDQYSLVMSIAFLVSIVAYGWGLYATK
jgi:hypothetical protein